ncbi:hypothetical protein GOP47_0026416 [Adiantum capillus-veneris]|nr:hypothetical protein GOP47_0026416 [Adiantum capillus-veneris]
MAPRRRVLLQVSDSSSSSSEGIANTEAAAVEEDDLEVPDSPVHRNSSNGANDDIEVLDSPIHRSSSNGANEDIEVLDSPTHRSSSNGTARDAFSANPNSDPPIINSIRPLFSASAPTSSSPFPSVNNAAYDMPINMIHHSRIHSPASFLSSSRIQDTSSPAPSIASRHAALEAFLQSRGVRPTPRWLNACVDGLATSRAGFLQLPASLQAEICFSHFLVTDLNIMGAAVLPPHVHTLHAIELAGPFVLQVDEITDIGAPIRQRYKERLANASRCLKLSMTDGVQRVYGIEYRPIRDLNVLSPAGFKVAVHHVNVRRGLLLLVPETVIVLGGQVECLEVARQRVVQHVNKPPRGSRSLRGTTSQSLAESASSAAWDTAQTRESTAHVNEQMGQLPRAPISGSASGNANQNTEDRAPCSTSNFSTRGVDNTGFTYLSLLKKQWASNQQGASDMHGKIKCVLTGVKEFHFKDREQFRLLVFIDDGSQIASVLIHNRVIQQVVGFSARQVSAALASSCPNEVIKMKENLSRFQAFLTKFEGMVLLQRDDETAIPIVIEMTEGCSKQDAWSLAERLRGTSALQAISVPCQRRRVRNSFNSCPRRPMGHRFLCKAHIGRSHVQTRMIDWLEAVAAVVHSGKELSGALSRTSTVTSYYVFWNNSLFGSIRYYSSGVVMWIELWYEVRIRGGR